MSIAQQQGRAEDLDALIIQGPDRLLDVSLDPGIVKQGPGVGAQGGDDEELLRTVL